MKEKTDAVVIGGGISGMEAAAALARLGAKTVIVEEKDRTGGHVARWHQLFPDGSASGELLKPLHDALQGVDIRLNTTVAGAVRNGNRYGLTLSDGTELDAGAVLLATGFSLFDARRKEEYGYGIYDRVITSDRLEQALTEQKGLGAAGYDPLRIGFVHCTGSRDEKVNNRHCSKICCATAVKQACELKELHPSARIYCFYMDLRMFGRGYEDMYLHAQNKYGIQFIRGRVSEVAETIEGKLAVKAEDTLAGQPLRATLDWLVLMPGMERHEHTPHMAALFNLAIAGDGFFQTGDAYNRSTTATQPGIFLAGACTGPKTYAECIGEARAAALAIYEYIRKI
ncbi:MAG: FAD-dependent oxidoreductase [Bacteroidales bacterium]|jgi:heterodisulfide reductase subunit A|nr:FAD-dependent oxidoreductase [Bacteroidales bacterium]